MPKRAEEVIEEKLRLALLVTLQRSSESRELCQTLLQLVSCHPARAASIW
jgi:hypothetical protein